MRRLRWWVPLSFLLILIFAGPALSDEPRQHPALQPDRATFEKWLADYRAAPLAQINERLGVLRNSLDLRSHLAWNASNMTQRDQNVCNDCWAWAGNGLLEVALHVQGVTQDPDRLSVQYVNSCITGNCACTDGGFLTTLVQFYDPARLPPGTGHAIPWSNAGAEFVDRNTMTCTVRTCDQITESPNYRIRAISASRIQTQDVAQATAIANIKNVLSQDKAVFFGFFLPYSEWMAFRNAWYGEPESQVWTPDQQGAGGQIYGHALLCIGYDDAGNWLMLNSWGTGDFLQPNRPNGLLRVSQNMNYARQFTFGPNFFFETLDVALNNRAPNTPSGPGPADGANACLSPILTWAGGDPDPGDTVTYTVYLDPGAANPTTAVYTGTTASYTPGALLANTDYSWKVTSVDDFGASASGPIWYFRTFPAATPPNDDVGTPLDIPGVPFRYLEDTACATTVVSDPTFTCGDYFVNSKGYRSVWFRYTPASAGELRVATYGSDYDTVLAVWAGAPSGPPLKCNDDAGDGVQSQVQMSVTSGTPYTIEVVDSRENSGGKALKLGVYSLVYLPIILK